MPKLPKFLVPLLKFGLASLLIFWMVRRGKLNLGDVAGALHRWPDLLLIALLYYACLTLISLRWHGLLMAEKIPIRFAETCSLTMIGQLFNFLIPSSVGGDIVKAYYLAGYTEDNKTRALTTILIDRILGLMVLLLMATVGALWNLPLVLGNRPVAAFCMTVSAITIAGLAGLALAVYFSISINRILQRMADRIPRLSVLVRMFQVLETYRRNPSVLPMVIAINLPTPVLVTISFALALHSLALPEVPFRLLLLIVPVGLVSLALPVTPAGIGVGQVAFYSLFQSFVNGRGVDGSAAFTVYQFMTVVLFLSGLVPYLRHKRPQTVERPRAASIPAAL